RGRPAASGELGSHSDVAGPVPAARLEGADRGVDELARHQRPAALELAEHVLAEASVLPQELGAAALPRVLADPLAAHPREDQRVVLDRADECPVLEQLPLLPEEPVELADVERAQAAPQDEVLGR